MEHGYGEELVLAPRALPLHFHNAADLPHHPAMLGVAALRQGVPLWFDAVNEHGLCMAGLRFPVYADYQSSAARQHTVAPHELIPWVLGQCRTADEAHTLLQNTALCDRSFSPALPNSPLHWMVADRSRCFVAEPLPGGLQLWENPAGVLTNSPPFPLQLQQLARYAALSPMEPPEGALPADTHGRGSFGLPGDPTSSSRFVRAAFLRQHTVCSGSEADSVRRMFEILQGVSQPRGAVRLPQDGMVETRYTVCCSAARGVYYYRTNTCSAVAAVSLRSDLLEGERPIRWPLYLPQQVLHPQPL